MAGFIDGPFASARFSTPRGVAFASIGGAAAVWVVDDTMRLRRLADGKVTTFAGNGSNLTKDGVGSGASFGQPWDVEAAPDGGLIVLERGGNKVRRVDADAKVTTIAGSSTGGLVDGPAAAARFQWPEGVGLASDGTIYVADTGNNAIRRVDTNGNVVTVAGSSKGFADDAGTLAKFNAPTDVVVDLLGQIAVLDNGNRRIRRLAANGLVTTLAGSVDGYADGVGSEAKLGASTGLAVAPTGTLYFGDAGSARIRSLRASAKSCKIGGICWSAATKAPSNSCKRCLANGSDQAWTAAPATTPCDDGNACTVADACDGKANTGSCAGKTKDCDDADTCTTDACNQSGSCVHTAIIGCGGNCTEAAHCEDGNACTDQACVDGKCANSANTAPCASGSTCSLGDSCSGGVCKAGGKRMATTIAGSGLPGLVDGDANQAKFKQLQGVAVGGDGTVWLVDGGNHLLRRFAQGKVSTAVGSGVAGYANGPTVAAKLNNPSDVGVRPSGGLVISDRNNHCLRSVDLVASTVGVFSGQCQLNGSIDGPAASARFVAPEGLDVDADGVVWVVSADHTLRRVTPDGTVVTLAGAPYKTGLVDGKGAQARFSAPSDVAVRADGSLVIADASNHALRAVALDGTVTTLAGGIAGYLDGDGKIARFSTPRGVAVGGDGAIFVADGNNHRVRRYAAGQVTTWAYTGVNAASDGEATSVPGGYPWGLAIDNQGALLVAHSDGAPALRQIFDSASTCSVAGVCYVDGARHPSERCSSCKASASAKAWTVDAATTPCTDGKLCTNGDACDTKGVCAGKAVDCDDGDKCTLDACDAGSGACTHSAQVGCGGNCSDVSDCDDSNACTNDACVGGKCGWEPNSDPCDSGVPCSAGDVCSGGSCKAGFATEIANAAGSGIVGFADGDAALAKFNQPQGLVRRASDGALFVADTYNHRLRRVSGQGTVSTITGDGTAGFADGALNVARFNRPADVGLMANGNLVVSDAYNHRIRVVSASQGVSTLAGSGVVGFADGKGAAAKFYYPQGIDTLADGTTFVADGSNHVIRRVGADGNVLTIAGGPGQSGYKDGSGALARFNTPNDVAMGPTGTLVVADYANHRIRLIDPDGVVSTLAGSTSGFVDAQGSSARFTYPTGVTLDGAGNVWVADRANVRVRRVDPSGAVSTVAGPTGLNGPNRLVVDATGTAWLADDSGHSLRSVRVTKDNCQIDGVCWNNGLPNPANSCQRCEVASSAKAWSGLKVGSGCDDGKPCTAAEACDDKGACVGAQPKSCDDKDACTTDSCDALTGGCQHVPIDGCF